MKTDIDLPSKCASRTVFRVGLVASMSVLATLGVKAADPAVSANNNANNSPVAAPAGGLHYVYLNATDAELAHEILSSSNPAVKNLANKGDASAVNVEYGMPRFDISVDQIATGQWLQNAQVNPNAFLCLVKVAGKYQFFATVNRDGTGKDHVASQSLVPNLQEITFTPENISVALGQLTNLDALKSGNYDVRLLIVHGVTAEGGSMMAISLKSSSGADGDLIYIPPQRYVAEPLQQGVIYPSGDCHYLLKPFALKMYAEEQAIAQAKLKEQLLYAAETAKPATPSPSAAPAVAYTAPDSDPTTPTPIVQTPQAPQSNPGVIYFNNSGFTTGGDTGSQLQRPELPSLPQLQRPTIPQPERPTIPQPQRPTLPTLQRPQLPTLPQPQRPTIPTQQ